MKKLFKKSPFYFFIFAIYPVLFLFSINLAKINPITALRPALLFLIGGSVIFFVMLIFTRNIQRNAVYSLVVLFTLFLVLFVLYAPVYQALRNVQLAGHILGRHRILVPLVIILIAIIGFLLLKFGKKISKKNLGNISIFFNIAASFLTVASIVVIAASIVGTIKRENKDQPMLPIEPLKVDQSAVKPDIYYIILDMHTNDNVLSKLFQYDGSSFTKDLQSKGFFVSQCSESNYDDTGLSLTSSMNMDYLQDFTTGVDAYSALKTNRVRRMLESIGYSTYAFETGYSVTEWYDADHYYSLDKGVLQLLAYPGLTDFESYILNNSAGKLLYEYRDGLSYKMQVFIDAPFVERRQVILNVLDTLPKIATQSGPKFVFAHMIAPHPPFVFNANGDPTFRRTPFTDTTNDPEYGKGYGWDSYRVAYTDELTYLHKRVVDMVDKIISESATPPIIIIQGDHGSPATKQDHAQFQILNAYYFPNSGDAGLNNTIEPVNSFRVLFNDYFNTNFSMLPDKSYIQEEKFYLADSFFPCP